MNDTDHPFHPGVEVVKVYRSWGGITIQYANIAKVYKTVKFTLEESNQQYRASFSDGEWTARESGGGCYRGPTIQFITPELLSEVETHKRNRRGVNAIEILSRSRDADFFTAEVVADLERLADLAKGSKP